MIRLKHIAIPTLLVAMLFAGCASREDPRGQRVAVQGSITMDGRPLSRARIVFQALNDADAITAVGSIANGSYQIPAEQGPLPGIMRVSIEPEIVDLMEFESQREQTRGRRISLDTVKIPARYNSRSELEANVTLDEVNNVFNFDLKSR